MTYEMTDGDIWDMVDSEAAYHADMLAFQKQALDALTAATKRPLTEDEAMLLAWLGGVSTEFYRAIRT